MKKAVIVVLVLLLASLLTIPASAYTPKSQVQYRGGTRLNFGSYANFNDSYAQCVDTNGTYWWSAIYQTFDSLIYTPCRTQMLADIDFLASNHVRTVRLWPVLSTFAYDKHTAAWGNLNSNIANLDEVLNELAKNNMKAYITLMSTPSCGDTPETTTNLGYYFNPDLVNNPTTQSQFMQAFSTFITRYKDNPAIYAYDLINEASLVVDNPPTKNSLGYCNLPYDSRDFTRTRALFAQMYSTAKSIDSLHSFTFSFNKKYTLTSPTMSAFHNSVDFYDIHAYSNNPASFYKNFPAYDKPVVHGEVGVSGTLYDSNGQDCEGVGSNNGQNILPAMAPECQQQWLANTQTFIQQAKLHHIQALFFQQWSASKSFGIHLYDSASNFTGYQMTSASQYVFSVDSGQTP